MRLRPSSNYPIPTLPIFILAQHRQRYCVEKLGNEIKCTKERLSGAKCLQLQKKCIFGQIFLS